MHKILIIAPAWVGDVVMSQTLFKRLHDKYGGDLILDVFASGFLHGLLERMPEVNQVILNPFSHGKFQFFKRIRVGLSLRKRHYDEVFVLPNSFKSAIVPFFAGIPVRTGFVGEFRYGLLNNLYKLDKEKLPLMIDRFCALAGAGKDNIIKWPKLTINRANQDTLCQKFNLNLDKPITAFCPGAEYGPAKQWQPKSVARLAAMLLEHGDQIIILGSSKDSGISQDILNLIGQSKPDLVINLCGKTSLADAVDLLALAKNVVTNDSGLMHIACAVGSHVVAVYGSTSPGFTPPLTKTAKILQTQLECQPCFARTCRFGHYNCLKMITPEMVLQQISAG